jgi:hypothetical protein
MPMPGCKKKLEKNQKKTFKTLKKTEKNLKRNFQRKRITTKSSRKQSSR